MGSNLLTLARDLHRPKARKRRKLALVEGWRLVEEALDAGLTFRGALVDSKAGERPGDAQLLRRLADHAIAVEEVDDREFGEVCSTETPQGILAIVEPRLWQLDELNPTTGRPVLVIDGVQDPSNVGALLRTTYALGGAGVAMLPGTAEPSNPRVIRGAMGATFHLPVIRMSEAELRAWVTRRDLALWAAEESGVPIDRVATDRPLALVVGNEGVGIRPEVRAAAEQVVAVPLARGADSLNVAVAAGILLYEVRNA